MALSTYIDGDGIANDYADAGIRPENCRCSRLLYGRRLSEILGNMCTTRLAILKRLT